MSPDKLSKFNKLSRLLYPISAALIAVLAFVVIGYHQDASAATATGGNIVGVGSKCLDNKGARTTAGNPVQLWTCSSTSTAQKWTWTGDATIRTQNRCLDAKSSGINIGTLVVINSCSGAASQNWALQANGSIVNSNSHLCLADRNSSTTNGNPIWLYTCDGSRGQTWNISKAVVALPQTAPSAHSPLPAGTPYTLKPTITLVTYAAPEFAPWMQNQLKPLLEQWYPVLGDYFAYPEYVPSSNITIVVDPTYTGIAYTSGTTIVFSTSYFRSHLSDAGAFLHEATHVVQWNPARGLSGYPSWLIEGEADFTREHIYNDRVAVPAIPSVTYLDGYTWAANLIEYARTRSTLPNFAHSVNVAGWQGTYTDDFWLQNTGVTLNQLWTNMTGQVISSQGTIRNNATGYCLDLPYFATADGTRINAQSCNGYDAQKWMFVSYNSTTTGAIKGYGNKCIDVSYTGTTNGTAVWYYTCNYGAAAQQWTPMPNGSLMNPYSGKCLQTIAQSNTQGSWLEISTCDGSTAQQWILPPLTTLTP